MNVDFLYTPCMCLSFCGPYPLHPTPHPPPHPPVRHYYRGNFAQPDMNVDRWVGYVQWDVHWFHRGRCELQAVVDHVGGDQGDAGVLAHAQEFVLSSRHGPVPARKRTTNIKGTFHTDNLPLMLSLLLLSIRCFADSNFRLTQA